MGRLMAASLLRQSGVTTQNHLAAINLGLKTIPVDRRRHRNRETRLLADRFITTFVPIALISFRFALS